MFAWRSTDDQTQRCINTIGVAPTIIHNVASARYCWNLHRSLGFPINSQFYAHTLCVARVVRTVWPKGSHEENNLVSREPFGWAACESARTSYYFPASVPLFPRNLRTNSSGTVQRHRRSVIRRHFRNHNTNRSVALLTRVPSLLRRPFNRGSNRSCQPPRPSISLRRRCSPAKS